MSTTTFTLQVSEAQFRAVEAWTAREEQERARCSDLKIQSEELQRKKISELKERNATQALRLGELMAAESTRDAAELKSAELCKKVESLKRERDEFEEEWNQESSERAESEEKLAELVKELEDVKRRCSILEEAAEVCEVEWKEVSEECNKLAEERREFEVQAFAFERQLAVVQRKFDDQKRKHALDLVQRDGQVSNLEDELNKAHANSKSAVAQNRELEEEMEEQKEVNELLVEQLEEQKEAHKELAEQQMERIRALEEQLADKEANNKRLRSKVSLLKAKLGDTSPVLEYENRELKRKLFEAEDAMRNNLPVYTAVVEPPHKKIHTISAEEHVELVTKDFYPFGLNGEAFDPKKFFSNFDEEFALTAL